MANNRKTTRGRKQNEEYRTINNTPVRVRVQTIFSGPQRVLKEKYLSPKGKRLVENNQMSEELAWKIYGKNRYIDNPEPIHFVKEIIHILTD